MIKELENWYQSNCNEEWEHQFGIRIVTLDNPGWKVEIDLEGTKLENIVFKKSTIPNKNLNGFFVK